MIGTPAYLHIVRASAWYDLVVTIGFATPWTFLVILSGLEALSRLLGITAGFPTFEPAHMLMVNLLGSIVTIWSILRLRDPQVQYGRYDAAGRFLFSTWQLYALVHGAHPIVWGFLVIEVAFGIAQVLPIDAGRRAKHVPSPQTESGCPTA
ncbi:hypothetical protein H3H37_17045 [Duganella sp. LX20W]|uniref:Uncharacterized protein n=1 Tax=Rugamonas brunnea TaxID=2758569 RepID=A0A7W2EUC1_9BURK|nr:hypothetical protein [Rugamonas brunnea]MBA5638767.1 hypothetical protein [Rugamonas brunnea]